MAKLLVAAFAFCTLSAFANEPPQTTQFRGDETHNGLYYEINGYSSVKLKWSFKAGNAIRSTPLILGKRVFVGSADNYLYALDTSGNLLWKFKADAAIHSSPAAFKNTVCFSSRANTLYVVDQSSGKLKWQKQLGQDLPYEWSFDYYISSPLVSGSTIYTGSGDGYVYALNAANGNVQWKFNTGSRVRSTPAMYNDKVYFGDCAGKVYALDKSTGTLVWQFATIGDTLKNENFGFDRKAIIASPAISYGDVVVGSRDGYLYAIDAQTGTKKWQYNYNVSWVISSVAIKDSIVVTGTSDGRFINALHLRDGKELWRFAVSAPVWSSPSIVNDKVFNAVNDGNVYCLDLYSGKEIWRFRTNERLFSSPVPAAGNLYVGNDEGMFYCLQGTGQPASTIHRAVYWIKDPPFQYHRYGIDVYLKDYFASAGYKVLNAEALATFMRERIADAKSSVVVFATNLFPPEIIGDTLNSNLLLQYLNKGGKIVITGMNPAVYNIDEQKKELKAINFHLSQKVTGIAYAYNDTRSFGGYYPATPTLEGNIWGLKTSMVTRNAIPVQDVNTVLAIDETGKAAWWVKNYGGRPGSGFVQTWLFQSSLPSLSEILQVAEYGLDK
jgi:eukaryotic-like serine/threonine-protein kinase